MSSCLDYCARPNYQLLILLPGNPMLLTNHKPTKKNKLFTNK